MRALYVILAILLIPLSYAVVENYGGLNVEYADYIHVHNLKYEPYPAEPGSYVDVWIKIQNSGYFPTDVKFKLVPKYPFILGESEEEEKDLGEVGSGETALVKYKIRVNSNAVEGSTPLHYEIKTSRTTIKSTLNIWVQTVDAEIAVSSIEPYILVPGKITPVKIEVENRADSPMNNINIKLNVSNVPFVPINSTAEKGINLIEPKQKEPIVFNLMAMPAASANAYKVPIEIRYVDGVGKNYTKSSVIGLIIGSEPEITMSIASSEIYKKGDTGKISLKIVNKGLTDIKLMNIVLKESPDYNIISEETVYIGNIDTDDYETADYRIKAKKVKKGILILNVELDYLDANNNRFTQLREVELKVVSAKALGVKGGSGFARIIFLIIIIGVGFYYYRKWEKKKLSKK